MFWIFVINCIIGYGCSVYLMQSIEGGIDRKYHNLIRIGIILTGIIWLPVVYHQMKNDNKL